MTESILKTVAQLPTTSDLYLWCDYVELRCLTHPDHRYSRGNLLEIIDDNAALCIARASQAVANTHDDEQPDDDDVDDDQAANTDEMEDDDPEMADRREAAVAGLFHHLASRADLFGEAYPFVLAAGEQELRLKEEISAAGNLYLQLLLSSSLRLIPNTRRKELTGPFEDVSYEIFKALMPPTWEVHAFGAAAGRRARYTGHLFDRLTKLASDWRGTLKAKKRHFKRTNVGDGGLDLVAWHPLGSDGRVGIPAAAAQCGCTADEWPMKQLAASPDSIQIDIHHRWATYYFMPLDLYEFVDGQSDWQRRNDIKSAIVIDRLRIVRLAKEFGIDGNFRDPPKPVQDALDLALA